MSAIDPISRDPRELDDVTSKIIEIAIRMHRELGPGLLESVYERVLTKSLERRGLAVETQRGIRFDFDGITFHESLRIDLLVEGKVIVEVKSAEKLAPVHSKQVLTYLRLLDMPVGLLINFGGSTLKEGLHRIVNRLDPSSSPHLRVNKQADDVSQI